jgi:hypothetical protein
MTMNGSMALRVFAAVLAISFAAPPAIAFNPNPPRDPRTAGLGAISAGTLGDEIVRVDRWPDGKPRRCVRAARLDTPAEGGPSRIEFGVERASPAAPDATMSVRVQYLDRPDGMPLPVRDLVFEMQYFGPAIDWRLESLGSGWIRLSKSAARSGDTERNRFANEVGKPGNTMVSTFPDGTHRLHRLRSGVSPWHFEMFFNCACKLLVGLPRSSTDGFPCPELRRE